MPNFFEGNLYYGVSLSRTVCQKLLTHDKCSVQVQKHISELNCHERIRVALEVIRNENHQAFFHPRAENDKV